ncbi:MAG: TonB-dependent receptor [Sphingobacteriales bacterium]|nr:TonB-dependent receptor [Sphingobacteriales bacterium]
MKKEGYGGVSANMFSIKKTILFMKISAIFLLLAMQVSATNYAQGKINLNAKDISLSDVLNSIEKQTSYRFNYSNDVLPGNKLISVNVVNADIKTVLSRILEGLPVKWSIEKKNNIFLNYSTEIIAAKAITGTVMNDKGEPLANASVIVKGTSAGTVTKEDGSFTINANVGDVLVFSAVGYNAQALKVGNQNEIIVTLAAIASSMDEVVVVGYGTQKKKDITGSVAVIEMTDAKKLSTNDVGNMLQGRIAGVFVTSDGQPGAFPQVKLRGVSTFGNSDPLYVVDGIPLSGVPRELNPNDIQSMQVLKDASAGAVYGSRAANGVIIITTKQGRRNVPLKVEYSAYYGTDKVWQIIPVTNAHNYQVLNNEARFNSNKTLAPGNDPNSSRFITNINTDWQNAGLKNGTRQNHNLNLSGGGEHNTYNVSLDMFDNKGTFVGNGPDYRRYTGRINTTQERGRFKFGQTVSYAHSKENALVTGDGILAGGRPPLINDLVFAIPTMPLYDSARLGGFGGTASDLQDAISLNGVGFNSLIKNNTTVGRFITNLWSEVNLFKNDKHSLKYRLNLGYDVNEIRDLSFTPKFNLGYFFINSINRVTDNHRKFENQLIENTLNYDLTVNSHNLSFLLGQMYQKNSYWLTQATGQGFQDENFASLKNAQQTNANSWEEHSALASYLGRINYNYADRYLLTATLRRDASSRFAPQYRVGYFPAFAAGWRLSNESFFPQTNGVISDLKLRASWGKLGNENIGNYLYQAVINPSVVYTFNDGQRVLGGIQTSVVTTNLKWEERNTSNIGLDAQLFNRKFDLSVEYYSSESRDILVPIPIPLTVGSINAAPIVNAGSLRNNGLEFSLAYHKTRGEFTFDIAGNFTTINNKVLSLGGDVKSRIDGAFRTEVGKEVGRHYGFIAEGIFKTQAEVDAHPRQFDGASVGDVIYKDMNGDKAITDADRTDLGSGLPKINYGFNFNAAYKGFDFTLFASGMGKYLINSRLYRDLMHSGGDANYHRDMLNRYTSVNTETNIPRLIWSDPNRNWESSNREGWLQDGTFLRVNTLSLGYTLPKNSIRYVSNLRVYVTSQNLYTFQKYKAYNPDYAYGVFTPGLDNGSYPKPRTILFGVQVGF